MFKNSSKKTRVFPQGLAISGDELTSFILFKDKKDTISFPVWCPILPLGFAPSEGEYNVKNPYDFTHGLVEKLGFKITECIFDDIKADDQMASVCIEVNEIVEKIKGDSTLNQKKMNVSSKKLDQKTEKSKKVKKHIDPSQLSFLESNLTNSAKDLYRPVQKISMKAFEALALCGSKKDVIFSATDSFIQKTRDVAVFEKSNPSESMKKNSFLKSRQKYLM